MQEERKEEELQSSSAFVPYAVVPDVDIRSADPTGEGRLCRAIYTGLEDGDIAVKDIRGVQHEFPVGANVMLPLQVAELVASATTLTNIIVFW